MPTTLPDRARQAKRQGRPFYARLGPLLAAFLYLLLLAWNVSALEADFVSIAPADIRHAYSPIEAAHGAHIALSFAGTR